MRSDDGFTLIEASIATALLATALLALAQLVTTTVVSNVVARHATAAVVLASQKVDELRSVPAAPSAGIEYIDQWGAVVGSGASAPRGAIFVRTWTMQPSAGATLGTLIVQVHVARLGRASEEMRLTAAMRPR